MRPGLADLPRLEEVRSDLRLAREEGRLAVIQVCLGVAAVLVLPFLAFRLLA